MNVLGFGLQLTAHDFPVALLISFFTMLALVGLCYYLDRQTGRRCFAFWTVSWIFYALWLALRLGLQAVSDDHWSIVAREWCLCASAVFLFWGSVLFLKQQARPTGLVIFLGFLFVWSYVGAFGFENAPRIQVPLFGLFGLCGLVTAAGFYRLRREQRLMGAGLLTAGFSLWGIHLAASPLLQSSEHLISANFVVASILQLFLAGGVIILSLEFKEKNTFLQKKIASTEERYRSLFDQASEGIVITDADTLRVLELNQTAKRLLGINNGELIHANLSCFCRLHSDTHPAPRTGPEWFAALCRRRNLNLVRRDGAVTPVELEGAPIGFEGRAAYQFFLRELTERARLEQQLRQAEKLSALGQMISGIAHELNNPLAVVTGYLQLILARDELADQTRADLEKVARESQRAAKLVNNFLSFARQQPMQHELVQLNDLISQVVELRKLDLRNGAVELRLNLEPNLPPTFAGSDQIQQVLINLVNNALDALATAGRPGVMQICTRRKEDLIVVTVEDNGGGVPAEVLPNIFEPFFTTKEVGKGTGLGLSIAHSVLADHNGRLFYQPSPLGGAAFVIELPIVSESSEIQREVATDSPLPASPAPQHANILILDDERSIAELLSEMLDMLGYSTTICHSGAEALELLEGREFDLIISDYRMPKMNGRDFYRAAIGKKPGLATRVVFITGDVVNDDTQDFLRSIVNPHLNKPFQLARVERIVAEVLQRNSLGAKPSPPQNA